MCSTSSISLIAMYFTRNSVLIGIVDLSSSLPISTSHMNDTDIPLPITSFWPAAGFRLLKCTSADVPLVSCGSVNCSNWLDRPVTRICTNFRRLAVWSFMVDMSGVPKCNVIFSSSPQGHWMFNYDDKIQLNIIFSINVSHVFFEESYLYLVRIDSLWWNCVSSSQVNTKV